MLHAVLRMRRFLYLAHEALADEESGFRRHDRPDLLIFE
jgi:hypothetical protein